MLRCRAPAKEGTGDNAISSHCKAGVGGGGGGIGGSPALQPILPTLSLFLILSFSPSSLAFSGNAMITGRHVYF